MEEPKLPWLTPTVFAVALVALILDAGSGPGWGGASAHAVLATRFEQVAASPLYNVIASAVTTIVPAGEPGFRLGLLGALLGACTLAGIVAAARALLPRDPLAGVVGAAILILAPGFRDAASSAAPALLVGGGLVWAIAFALRAARPEPRDPRDAVGALAACGLVIGGAPWLGALVTIAVVVWLARAHVRRDLIAIVLGGLGALLVVLWLQASGSLPGVASSQGAALLVAGRGSGAIVLGAGLIGIGFGALTGLSRVRPLAVLLALVIAHEVVVGGNAAALLALCAIGATILPGAIVRAAAANLDGLARHAVTISAGLPLVVVSVATGAAFTVEDPGAEPRHLAHDLVDNLPPGTGVFVATRPTSWLAIHHEMVVAGARPDLTLVPPIAAEQADAIVAGALRAHRIAGSDTAAFGRLDIARAIPRGRGFQMLAEPPPAPTSVLPPATYATQTGIEQSTLLALERARYEGANGRLDAAARAAGLEQRFGAADLAVLGATVPTRERPALFGLLPRAFMQRDVGPWLLDLFGDDLAWVAGIAIPPLPAHAPVARRLHARWREILSGNATPDDPEIAAMGDIAVQATRELFVTAPSETDNVSPATDSPSDPARPSANP